MSKISPLIAQYLTEQPMLSLEKLGIFTVENNAISSDGERITASKVNFQYLPSAVTDDAFLNFVVKHTGKIPPLASADLESYLNQGRQLLNISKPLVIDGVGTLNKNSMGIYEFTPGVFEFQKVNTSIEKEVKEPAVTHHETSLKFNVDYQKGLSNKRPLGAKLFGAIAVLGLLTLLAIVGYKYVFAPKDIVVKNSNSDKVSTSASVAATNAVEQTQQIPQSVDSLGRFIFRIAVRETDSIGSITRRNQLRGSKYDSKLNQVMQLMQVDVDKNIANGKYRVFITLRAKPTDTAAYRAIVQSNYVGSVPLTAYYF